MFALSRNHRPGRFTFDPFRVAKFLRMNPGFREYTSPGATEKFDPFGVSGESAKVNAIVA